jgi:hypothetical protein
MEQVSEGVGEGIERESGR